jgi:shikimate 5-dehydrogenase
LQSLSPTIRNAAFAALGLYHDYDIQECASLIDVEHLINDNEFGGASVTMPHKLSVGHYCNENPHAATKIGAINTLVARQNDNGARTIYGDNTDWTGLYFIVVGYPPLESSQAPVGLDIGAGGAARAAVYALAQAGVKRIYVWNQTVDKARKIAIDFRDIGSVTVAVHQSETAESPDIIIGTISGEVLPRSAFI